MLKIDYDAVTIDIQDYIIDICMVTTDLLENHKVLNEIDPRIFIIQQGIYKHISFHLDDDCNLGGVSICIQFILLLYMLHTFDRYIGIMVIT